MYLLKTQWRRTCSGRLNFIPGLLLASLIASVSYLLFHILRSSFSVNIASVVSIALLISITTTNIWSIPKDFHQGIKFSLNKVLALAIILLGFRLNWSEIALVGPAGISIIFVSLLLTFVSTYWLGKYLGLNTKLIQLIACGTSICGTSAIVAINGVLNASEDDIACAVVTVTAFGSIAMILYPLLPIPLVLTPQEFGLWCGTSIQQTSQVVAAGFQQGIVSGELATITKLSRVTFLVPVVFLTGLSKPYQSKRDTPKSVHRRLPIPFFMIAFVGVICLNSLDIVPHGLKNTLIEIDKVLITISMVAVGLETKLVSLRKAGLKPLLLGGASWLCLALVSLFLIKLLV